MKEPLEVWLVRLWHMEVDEVSLHAVKVKKLSNKTTHPSLKQKPHNLRFDKAAPGGLGYLSQ